MVMDTASQGYGVGSGGGAYFCAPVRPLAACGQAGADGRGALAFPLAYAQQGGCYWAVPVLPTYYQVTGLLAPHDPARKHNTQCQSSYSKWSSHVSSRFMLRLALSVDPVTHGMSLRRLLSCGKDTDIGSLGCHRDAESTSQMCMIPCNMRAGAAGA